MAAPMKKDELVFVPLPCIGHIASILEFSKLLVDRDDRFSVTILIVKLPILEHDAVNNCINSFSASVSGRIRFHHLPQLDSKLVSNCNSKSCSPIYIFCNSINEQKCLVRDAVKQLTRSESTRLVGFVFDMLCTSLVDVADEFGVPSYVFFASSAAFLGLMFHLQALHDYQGVDVAQLVDSDVELVIPSFVNSVPSRLLPAVYGEKEGGGTDAMMSCSTGFKAMKGILVNTFVELESHAVDSLVHSTNAIPIYPVGPLLNLKGGEHLNNQGDTGDILNWLYHQPPASVVFLCFGSNGVFPLDQIREIARGLERSGHRFLWALRRPPPNGELVIPDDYMNVEEVLPEGFLGRAIEIGKVIGWAPQLAILAHPSVGGFVTHCGWNSILESIWHGVPIATWPVYSEQQLNAFEMVKEIGSAVEIKLDYTINNPELVSAEEIEIGIKRLMDDDNKRKRKMKEMGEKGKNALIDGGSSYLYLQRFIEDILINIA